MNWNTFLLKSAHTLFNRNFDQMARSAAASGSPEAPGEPGWPTVIVQNKEPRLTKMYQEAW